jgi:hypothetical protein
MRRLFSRAAAGTGFLVLLVGCANSEEDRRAAQDPATHSSDRPRVEDFQRLDEAQRKIHDLRGKLDDLQAKIDDAATAQAKAESRYAPAKQGPSDRVTGSGPTRCADGSTSGESGRGACSHHGGIAGSPGHQRH